MNKLLTTNFTKMHGLGNDFIVINNITESIDIFLIPIQHLSHRYTGIGFDQLLLLETSTIADFSCRFFNADASEAEQCGNGVRCIARYVHEQGLTIKKKFCIETKAGVIDVIIHDYEHIQVSLGIPKFSTKKTLILGDDNQSYDLSILSMGNPHAILEVSSVDTFPVKQLGAMIATHSTFPSGTNVGFIQVINPNHFLLRTFERGVGETYACGSNACAAAAAGMINKILNKDVTVELPLGKLHIQWEGDGTPIIMTGPAETVFVGQF